MPDASIDLDVTAHEHARRLRAGDYTSRALAEATLARVRAQEPALHAYVTLTDELALEAADAADARLRHGDRRPAHRHPDLPSRTLWPRAASAPPLVAHARELRAALRLHRRRAPRGRRRDDRRQDQPRRVRHGLVDRELRVRPDAQPVGPRPRARRLVRRLAPPPSPRAACRSRPRHRHRRLDPPAGRALRHRRPQADVRARQPVGRRRLRVVARPDRALRARRRGRGDPAARDRRPATSATPPRVDVPVPDFTAQACGAASTGCASACRSSSSSDGLGPQASREALQRGDRRSSSATARTSTAR